jgi:hypothetical protein
MTLIARSVLVVLLYLALAFTLAAQVSPMLSQKADDAAEMTAIAEREGHVSVIVEFDSPIPPGQIKPDPNVLVALKAKIAEIQDAIIADHFGNAASPNPGRNFDRSLQRFDITPMFALNVNRAELEALAADPRVVRIHQNKVGSPT